MKYSSIFLLLCSSLTCAMEPSGHQAPQDIRQTLSEISLIMKDRVPRELIAATQQEIFKQNSDITCAQYQNKINEKMIFLFGQPRAYSFDSHKVRQAAITDQYVFLLGHNGSVMCYCYSPLPEMTDYLPVFADEITSECGLVYRMSLHSNIIFFHGPSGYLGIFLNGDNPSFVGSPPVFSPFVQQQDLKLITHKDTIWFPAQETKDVYRPYDTKRSGIEHNPVYVPQHEDLLFTADHCVVYESAEPDH